MAHFRFERPRKLVGEKTANYFERTVLGRLAENILQEKL
jgi:hypothetical protein